MTTDAPWFGFLIHPRSTQDLLSWRGASLLRKYSQDDDDFVRKATTMEPVVAGEVRFGLGGPWGELVGIVRLPEQILTPFARTDVLAGVRLAADRGAAVVGLGALTAPATVAGRAIVKNVPAGVALTTGNAYTSAVARHNVREAATARGRGGTARVAVLGATGSVGAPTARMLVQDGYDVVLVGRNAARVRAALPDLDGPARIAEGMEGLADADIVLVVTIGASALLRPEQVRAGSVVVDLTQPTNIDPATYPDFAAKGVAVVAGGTVRIRGYRSTYVLPTGDRRTTFACLAETYLMSKEGIREHSVGVPSTDLALRLDRIAGRHGVAPEPLNLDVDPDVDLNRAGDGVTALTGPAEKEYSS